MLRSNSKSQGNLVVSHEEKERLQWEGFVEKEGFNAVNHYATPPIGHVHRVFQRNIHLFII